jgi:hypothetical protein
MEPNTLEAFNKRLVETGRYLMVRDYLMKANRAVFHQDIAGFANELLDLDKLAGCCIPHIKLVEYGVLSAEDRALRLFEQEGLKEGADYRVVVREDSDGGPERTFFLHPEAFKLCLIRAENTLRYVRFYSLLSRVFLAYDAYQRDLEQKYYYVVLVPRHAETVKNRSNCHARAGTS